MKSKLAILSLLFAAVLLAGCASNDPPKQEPPPAGAPINNNAPGAADAPAAPVNPDVPRPGHKRI